MSEIEMRFYCNDFYKCKRKRQCKILEGHEPDNMDTEEYWEYRDGSGKIIYYICPKLKMEATEKKWRMKK